MMANNGFRAAATMPRRNQPSPRRRRRKPDTCGNLAQMNISASLILIQKKPSGRDEIMKMSVKDIYEQKIGGKPGQVIITDDMQVVTGMIKLGGSYLISTGKPKKNTRMVAIDEDAQLSVYGDHATPPDDESPAELKTRITELEKQVKDQ